MSTRYLVLSLILAMFTAAVPRAAHAESFSVGISVGFPPPPLPVYLQPPCPEPGYIWTPGYWAYDDEDDYYWVPGTWVFAPAPGLLWTPGYWSEDYDNDYVWHPGYWAPHVGFYGGVDYGYGYFGVGFVGGYWHDRDFYYNRAVANVVNIHVRNIIYDNAVHDRYGEERASFNGREGVHARPSDRELPAQREPHRDWTLSQQSHALQARTTPALRASFNQGRPPIAATGRPGVFAGRGIVAARPDSYSPSHADRGVATVRLDPYVSSGTPPHTPSMPIGQGRQDARAYPPAFNASDRPPAYQQPYREPYREQASPSYPRVDVRPPGMPWARPNESRLNADAWRPSVTQSAHAYGPPAMPQHPAPQRYPPPQRYSAPPAHSDREVAGQDRRQR